MNWWFFFSGFCASYATGAVWGAFRSDDALTSKIGFAFAAVMAAAAWGLFRAGL